MTLSELIEPLFQDVCRHNRVSRTMRNALSDGQASVSGNLSAEQVRTEMTARLAEIRSKAVADPALSNQFDQVEPVLEYFLDFTVPRMGLPGEWQALAPDLVGEDKFWDLQEETMRDTRPAALERLKIFYTCAALGFTGRLELQPELLRRKMREMHARIEGRRDDEEPRLFDDAYRHTDTTNLVRPPSRWLGAIAISLAVMSLFLLLAFFLSYQFAAQGLREDLGKVVRAPAPESSAK